jgi:hypothetical protein
MPVVVFRMLMEVLFQFVQVVVNIINPNNHVVQQRTGFRMLFRVFATQPLQ